MRRWFRNRVPMIVFIVGLLAISTVGAAPNKWTHYDGGCSAQPDREQREQLEKMLTPSPSPTYNGWQSLP